MTQLTDKPKQVWAVEVPEGAENFRILSFSQPNTFSYDYSITREERVTRGLIAMIDLPPGNWRYICTSKEVKASHAPQLFGYAMIGDEYAKETMNSLLDSKGLPVDGNYVYLENIKA